LATSRGADGAGGGDCVTGVTFGYMYVCGNILLNRRSLRPIPYVGASVIFGTHAESPAVGVRLS
jgi:hypothetical protein